MSDRDTSFNQSRDGFNVFEPTPFLPSFGSKFDKTDDDFGVSLDLTGYSVDFNQGYIFNSVSSGQVSPDYITIGNMTGHVLPLEHDNHYYVEVKLNAQNFKVNCATLTGVSNNSTGDLTNSFPHVKFDQYDAGVIEFTGYYPILRLQNGDLTEFHQRGDIVLSDRQFKQKGSFVEGTSAHVLVAENRKDDNFPVRVRAILGRSGITVTQNEDYIVLDAEAASGSGGDTGAKNIGTAVEVYDDGPPATRNPFEFRTLRGNIQTSHAGGAYENANNSVTVGLASDMYAGGSEDEILISGSYCQNVGSQAEVFVNPSIRDFKFRTLKGEDDIKVEQQAEVIVISYTGECCDLQETTDKGRTTTTPVTFGSSTALGSSPVNIVTKETGNGGATVYAHGDTTNPVVEVECDSADHGIIKTNSTDGAKSTEMGSDSSSQGTISTYNGAGTTEFTNIGGTTNGGTVSTNATDGTKSTEITSDSNKRGQVDVYNTAGNTVQSKLGADNNGGVIQTNADDGTKSVDLTSDSNNRGKATVYNADGDETRVVIEVDSNDRGSTSTLDANENLSTKITSDTSNRGVIETYNAAGGSALTSIGGTNLGGIIQVNDTGESKSVTVENDTINRGVVKTFNGDGNIALTSIGGTTLGGIVQVNDTGEAKSVTVENDSSHQGVIKTFNGAGNTALTSIGGTTLGGIIQVNDTGEAKSVTVENDSSDQGVIKTFNAAGSTALTSVGASTNGGEINVNATDDTVSVKITNDGSKRGKLEVYNAAGSTALTTIEADSSDNGKLTQKTSAGAVVNQVSADASTDTYFNSGPVGLGTSEPSAGYAVDVKGTAKVFSSSTPADGLIQLGTATNQTMGVVGGSSNFVYGAGMSSFLSDSDETLDVFATNSAGYSAIDAYIIGSSPATGSAIMAGSGNSISGHFNVIVAGAKNLISGGTQNFIGGGTGVDIIASTYSVNVGGEDNDIVSGRRTVIGGGFRNKITGAHSANIGGGSENVIEKGNYKSIGGGFQNVISGNSSSSAIAGGLQNKILGDSANYSFIGAGGSNTIKGNSQGSTIAGGVGCIISNSSASFAGGGNSIIISGSDAVALGNYSHVQQGHDGAFVFTDANTTPVLSTGKNTMVMKFESGVFVETTSGLYVNGNPVLTGETPEGDTLQSVTSRGDTTTTNIISEKIVSGVSGLFSDRVGIGTTEPAYTLEVDVSDDDWVRFKSDDNKMGIILSDDDTVQYLISENSALSLGHQASLHVENLNILDGGNVGIGTNNPQSRLHIGNATGSTLGLRFTNPTETVNQYFADDSTDSDFFITYAGNGGAEITLQHDGKLALNASNGDNVGVGTDNPRTSLHVSRAGTTEGGIITVDNPNNSDGSYCGIEFINSTVGYPRSAIFAQRSGGSYDADLTFHTSSTNEITGSDYPAATERMRITHDGHVGIGTNNPSGFSSSARRLVIGEGAASEGMSIFAGTSSDASIYFADGTAGAASYQGFIVYKHSDSRMDFGAAGGRRMIMNGNGLLIAPNGGVFSPSAELEIASSAATIRLTDSDLTNHYSEIEKAGVYTYLSSRANAADGGFIFFGGGTDTEFMRIETDGDVGIGSSVPSAKLDVAGGIKLLDSNYLSWNSSNTRIVGNSSYLQFQVAASDKVRIQSDGHVGIGTTTAPSELTVFSTDSESATASIHCINNNATGALLRLIEGDNHQGGFLQYDGSANKFNIGVHSTNDTTFANDTKAITIDRDTAKVGIGTTSPDANLDVTSTANQQHLKIQGAYAEGVGALAVIKTTANGNALSVESATTSDSREIFEVKNSNGAIFDILGNGNVGIGSASPSFVLDTVFAGDNGARLRSTDNHSSLTVQSHASYGAYLRFSDGGNRYWLQARSDDKLQFRPNASLLESACIYFDETGKVGIGVSNPTEKLEINPDTDVSAVIGKAHVGFMIGGDYAGFAHLDNASSSSYALLQSAGGDTYLNCDNGNQLFFRKNNSTLGGFNSNSDFYVDTDTLYVDASADSVGINDPTPSYPLDVNGIIRTQSGLLGTQFGTGPCTTIDGFFASTSTEDYGFQNALLMNDLAGFTKWAGVTIKTSGLYKTRGGSAGSYTYSNEAGTGDFDRAFQANNHTVGSWYTDSGPDGDITTGVASTGVIELYFNGVKSLNYSAQAAAIFGSASFRATHVKIEAHRTGAWQTILDTTENTKTALIARIASNGGGANATTGLRYSFARAGNYFRINNLYAADYDLGNDLSYGGQYYIDKYYDGRHYSTLRPVTDGGADLGTSSVRYDGSYIDYGRFTNAVGIGTDTLTYRLNVSSSDDVLAQFKSTDNKAGILIQDNDTAGYVSAENDKFSIGPNNGTHTGNLTIDLTNSRVGIGTNAPAYPLDVVGTIHGTSGNFENGITIDGNPVITGTSAETDTLQTVTDRGATTTNDITISNTAATLKLQDSDGTNQFSRIRHSAASLYFYSRNDTSNGNFLFYGSDGSDNTELMRIEGGGDVGIGTNNPTEKLHVSGNILVTGAGSAGPHLKLAGTYTTWEIENQYAGGANNDMFRIRNTALGEDALVINRGNNRVGVGITAPTAALHVNGDGGTAAKIENGSLKIRYPANNDAITITPSVGNEGRILASDGDTSTPHPLKIGGDYVRITTSGVSAATEVARFTAEGNVGIGTSDPDAPLSVKVGSSTTEAKVFELVANDDRVLSILQPDNAQNNDPWTFATNNSYTFRVDAIDALNIDYAGNVGIGTTSPAQKLHIHDGHLRLNDTYKIEWGGSDARIDGSHSSDYLRFFTSNTERIRIVDGGNVGIGTTEPAKTLDVDGDTRVNNAELQITSSSSSYTTHFNYEDGGSNYISYANGGATIFRKSSSTVASINSDGVLNVGAAGVTNTRLHVTGARSDSLARFKDGDDGVEITTRGSSRQQIDFLGSNTSAINAKGSLFINYDSDNGGSNDTITFARNGVDEAGTVDMIITEGKVGIGLTNPSTALDVVGTKGSAGVITVTDAASVAAGVGGEIDFKGIYQGTTKTVFGSIEAKKTNATAGDYGAGLALSTRVNGGGGLTERLTILESGNVGIGQTSPSAKLQVNGDVRVEGSSSLLDMDANAKIVGQYYANGEAELTFLRMYNSSDASINMGTKHAAGYISFAAGNGAYTERMRIENDGDVGIGTTVPTHTLHVKAQKDGDYVSRITNTEATAGANFGLKVDGGSNASDVTFEAQSLAGTSYFKVQGDGKVGIGSSSPSYELDVNGTTRSTYYVGGAYLEENASSSKLKFYTDGTVLVMDEDGELKPCEKENDTLVFGVTKRDFDSPVVLGAEPVLVTGPIKVGDYIVTSNKQGHGQSMKEQNIGTIIAQAMESGDGESYNIKAMVRKM